LDRQSDATILGDVETTLDRRDIPCTLESMQGRAVATNKVEMRAICAAFIDGIKVKQLTHMARHCLGAIFKDNDTIWANYELRYVGDGKLLCEDPYVGFVIFRRKNDHWKISAIPFRVSSNCPANVTLRDRAREADDIQEFRPKHRSKIAADQTIYGIGCWPSLRGECIRGFERTPAMHEVHHAAHCTNGGFGEAAPQR
jgi:hypothetical protein